MKIINDYPPIYAKALKVFPYIEGQNVCFTWGDTIYNPTGKTLPPEIIAHEEVHEKQQRWIGKHLWWWLYLRLPRFRLAQELPAHVVEYETFVKNHHSYHLHRHYLDHVAKNLAGPGYGHLILYEKARNLIQRNVAVKL